MPCVSGFSPIAWPNAAQSRVFYSETCCDTAHCKIAAFFVARMSL